MTNALPYKTDQHRTGKSVKRAYERQELSDAIIEYNLCQAHIDTLNREIQERRSDLNVMIRTCKLHRSQSTMKAIAIRRDIRPETLRQYLHAKRNNSDLK